MTYGNVYHGQNIVANGSNPATPAAGRDRGKAYRATNGMFAIGAGLEYGNLDEIFEIYDILKASFNNLDPGDDGETDPQEPLPDNPIFTPGEDIDWDAIIEQILENNPDFEEAAGLIKNQATIVAAGLALVSVEGYGKAFITADLPINFAWDAWGGSFTVGANVSASSKVLGITDPLNFDSEQALAQLLAAANLPSDSEETEFDLSGDLLLRVDKSRGDVGISFKNDSLLLTKASRVYEFSISYSRKWEMHEYGDIYWGVKPKLVHVGLTQVGKRIGDLTDSEALFDDIKYADFDYSTDISFDVGLIWQTDHYHLGASLINLNEPEFTFPAIAIGDIEDANVLRRLRDGRHYIMERQVKFQGGYHTKDRRWTLNAAYDANAVIDPMGDSYQWASISAGHNTDNWWIPGVRVGLHSNLSGTELTYVGAGVTLFKYFDLDVATTLDKVTLDGDTYPRGANISLAVSFAF